MTLGHCVVNFEPSSPAPLRTLLIADDQPSILVTLEFVLAGTYRVLRAENGAQAVAVATETAVDGALVDLHMPGMNGIETCRRLRALAAESGRSWPVWLMSAAASADARRVAAEAGACGFFAKPFPSDLLSQLATGLSSASAGSPAPS